MQVIFILLITHLLKPLVSFQQELNQVNDILEYQNPRTRSAENNKEIQKFIKESHEIVSKSPRSSLHSRENSNTQNMQERLSNVSKRIDNHIRSLSPLSNKVSKSPQKFQPFSNLNEKYAELNIIKANLNNDSESKNKSKSSITIIDNQIMTFGEGQNTTLNSELAQINDYKSLNSGYYSENQSSQISEERSNSREIPRNERPLYKKNSHDLSNPALNKISIHEIKGEEKSLSPSQFKNFNKKSFDPKADISDNILLREDSNNLLKNQLDVARKSSFNENKTKIKIGKDSIFNELYSSANDIVKVFDQPNEDNILAVSQNLHQLNLSQDNYQVTNESQLANNNIVINDDSNIFNKSQTFQGKFLININKKINRK